MTVDGAELLTIIWSGFLQVRENWKKSRKFEWSGKSQWKSFFWKVRENERLVPPDVRFSG